MHLLPRLYESLYRQTFRDFEWVIVDDGSIDGTRGLCESWLIKESVKYSEKGFIGYSKKADILRINYIYQNNGGKHKAINTGAKEAKGELFFIADSDDILPPKSLEIVKSEYSKIVGSTELSGICGLDSYFDGRVIGSGLPQERMISDNIELRLRFGVTGDMKEVFKTRIMREFPFPEIEGERFCSEDLVWNRISARYKMMYVNKIIYCAEYQSEGITSNIIRVRMESPIASTLYYSELEYLSIHLNQKIKAAINYWRFWFCLKSKSSSKRIPIKYLCLIPLGFFMHIIDIMKIMKINEK